MCWVVTVGHEGFDHEEPLRVEMGGDVAEAPDLHDNTLRYNSFRHDRRGECGKCAEKRLKPGGRVW